jgi:hypothetical protein
MKLQKLILLTVAMFAITFMGYGQVEPGEAPMFGNVRGSAPEFTHNFGKVSGTLQSYNFKIKNTGNTTMKIVDIQIPEKLGVTIVDMNIAKGSEGIIIVTVDPTIKEKGKFTDMIIVKTEQKEPGVKTTKEIVLTVGGEVK